MENPTRLLRAFALPAVLAAAAILALGVGAAWVCPGGACGVPAIDRSGLALLQALRTPHLDGLFQCLTWLGSLMLLLPLAVCVAWRARALYLPVVLLSTAGLSHLAKWLIERPRPDLFPAVVAQPWDFSFPSAHTMQACAFLLGLVLHPGGRVSAWVRVAASAIVSSVAVSRLYLQVHYPSDVLVGFGAAVLWVWAIRALPVWQGGGDEKQISRHG